RLRRLLLRDLRGADRGCDAVRGGRRSAPGPRGGGLLGRRGGDRRPAGSAELLPSTAVDGGRAACGPVLDAGGRGGPACGAGSKLVAPLRGKPASVQPLRSRGVDSRELAGRG